MRNHLRPDICECEACKQARSRIDLREQLYNARFEINELKEELARYKEKQNEPGLSDRTE